MEIKININKDSLRQWYLFANTPYYLFKHFKEAPEIANISDAYKDNPSLLIQTFKDSIQKDLKDFDNLVEIYLLIVALSFFDSQEVRDFFSKLD